MFKSILSFKGRIRRTEYCLSYLFVSIPYWLFNIYFTFNTLNLRDPAYLFLYITILILFVGGTSHFMLAQAVKRCHDLGNSGWFSLIPLFNPLWLMFAEGDHLENKYGPSPKQPNTLPPAAKQFSQISNKINAINNANTNAPKRKQHIILETGTENDVLYRNAVELINNNDYQKASSLIKTAITTFPDNPNYKRLQIVLNQQLNDISDFAKNYEQAEILFQEKQYDKALAVIEHLIALDPHPNNIALKDAISNELRNSQNIEAEFNNAFILYQKSDYKNSRTILGEILSNDPSNYKCNDLFKTVSEKNYHFISEGVTNLLNKKKYESALTKAKEALSTEQSYTKISANFCKQFEVLLQDTKNTIAINAFNDANVHFNKGENQLALDLVSLSVMCMPKNQEYKELNNKLETILKKKKQIKRIVFIISIILALSIITFLSAYMWNAYKEKAENDAWQSARFRREISGYLVYKEKYPNGKFSLEANTILDSLYWDNTLKDTLSYEARLLSLEEYINNVQYGKHKVQAQKLFTEITLAKINQKANQINISNVVSSELTTTTEEEIPNEASLSGQVSINESSVSNQDNISNSELTFEQIEQSAYDSYYAGIKSQGGIIAYVYNPGENGYERGYITGIVCSEQNLSEGCRWSNGMFIKTDAHQTKIGYGLNNTLNIISVQGTGVYAAMLCRNYKGGGFNDWYLPSKDELMILWKNRDIIGNFSKKTYWSSTDCDCANSRGQHANAWFQDFNSTTGIQSINRFGTDNAFAVRAIRVFKIKL